MSEEGGGEISKFHFKLHQLLKNLSTKKHNFSWPFDFYLQILVRSGVKGKVQ